MAVDLRRATAALFAACVPLLISPLFPPGGARAGDVDDILGGFEEEELGASEAVAPGDGTTAEGEKERFWDLDGSVDFSPSINFRSHSAPGPNGVQTSYTGVSRLRARLNLQLDVDLPRDWKGRLAGYAFADPIFAMRGRDDYTSDVLDEFEWEVDFAEVYVQGETIPDLDLKIGRQVVIWGRSDTIRVLDVLNPLDNREPGRVDIEDLRLPVAMLRADYYTGPWSLTAIAIPELRFSKNPPFGSDFSPFPFPISDVEPSASFDNTEWAVSVSGIFSGWDISFHHARFWNDLGHSVIDPLAPSGVHLEHARLWMDGVGANYTKGEWLLKGEFAWLNGLRFATAAPKSRLDAMIGVEYYGFTDTTLALEISNRHLLDFEPQMAGLPDEASENGQEIALRYSADFLNATLHVTALGLVFGWDASGGGVVRLSADYDVIDALVVGGGILLYVEGDVSPLSAWGRNDRIFARVKYSF